MINDNNKNLFEYLFTFKNPLDKKFRWEVNTAFQRNRITEKQRVSLLALSPQALYELSVCVRNGVKIDSKQVGNFYLKRAKDYTKQKRKKQSKFIPDFSI